MSGEALLLAARPLRQGSERPCFFTCRTPKLK